MPLERFNHRPVALWRGYQSALLEILQREAVLVAQRDPVDRSYEVIDGVAVIPICGVLVHEATWWSWDETEYSWLCSLLMAAVADPDVKGICLYVNSPGGEVAGCFDLADQIFALRGQKPIWAILDEYAYSAAYALASAADRIIVPRTGGTGSVGVISMHIDVTKWLEDNGIKVTTFQFGERKSDSYPTTPLSDEAIKRFQAEVDTTGEMFVSLVARNRKLDAAKVRSTEAATFLGAAGVAIGFADEVLAPADAFRKFSASLT